MSSSSAVRVRGPDVAGAGAADLPFVEAGVSLVVVVVVDGAASSRALRSWWCFLPPSPSSSESESSPSAWIRLSRRYSGDKCVSKVGKV